MESFSQSADTRYYYAYNERIFLYEVANKFIVTYSPEYSPAIKSLVLQVSGISGIESQTDSISIFYTDDQQSSSIKEIFLSQEGIKSVQPMYATENGLEMGVTADFVVKYNKDASPEEINQFHKKQNTTVRETTELHQILSVPPDSDALEIANAYQLSGLVEFSHPDFIAEITTAAEPCIAANGVTLYQNNPNPFSAETTIAYKLPENYSSANILIYNISGLQVKNYSLQRDADRVRVSAYDLAPGTYVYTLVVDGKQVGTKKMILTN
jgi:hypothetical protein